MKYQIFIITFFIVFLYCGAASATSSSNVQTHSMSVNKPISSVTYNMGHPVVKDLWVDPVRGSDANIGTKPSKSFRTLKKAWSVIPQSRLLKNYGYRINLMPGNYTNTNLPDNAWMQSRYGTYLHPIIIRSVYNSNKAYIKTSDIFNLYNCRYLYFIGLKFESGANNVVHLERCSHVLIKNVTIKGKGSIDDYTAPQEDLKANQCQNIYLENCNIYNAWNVPVDFVAVKNGHIIGNRIHQAGDWCLYLKGGSSHFLIFKNIIYTAKNGGFSAGQGTGFEFMVPPYIHYETYDIKFFNNIISNTNGAGMGVSGSYNILLAYNTLYKVGRNSHVLEFAHGIRSCGNAGKCAYYLRLGGWGTSTVGAEERIPNRNVYVYNNIIYNPSGYRSQWSQLYVENPVTPSPGSNIPSPSRVDNNLVIKGNIIWNGPKNLPLGIEGVNTRLKRQQLLSQNYINNLKPQLIGPSFGNYKPSKGGNVYRALTFSIPSFIGNDAPSRPRIDVGNLNNTINWDYNLKTRILKTPGAFT